MAPSTTAYGCPFAFLFMPELLPWGFVTSNLTMLATRVSASLPPSTTGTASPTGVQDEQISSMEQQTIEQVRLAFRLLENQLMLF